MTNSIYAPNTIVSADIGGLPHPEPLRGLAVAGSQSSVSLPPPVSSGPNVADSGRISFGAGFRLRSGK
ncbi:MAG: hypothetical protein WB902_08655 [Acetobacteraceae bacterium]|jgi:hypothetical protein